jgi:hypothetical protein
MAERRTVAANVEGSSPFRLPGESSSSEDSLFVCEVRFVPMSPNCLAASCNQDPGSVNTGRLEHNLEVRCV